MQVIIFLFITLSIAAFTYIKCRNAPRKDNDKQEYFLAGGSLPWFYVAGSIMLTNISTEQIVGMNGAQMLLVAWWEIAAAAGLIILARWIIPIYFKYKCTTTVEILEHKFKSKTLRATVSTLFLIGYVFILLPTVLYTGSLFLKSMFNLDYSIISIAIVISIIGSLYAIYGGLRAIAVSDSFNGIGLLVMGLVVTILSLNAIDFDFSGIPADRMTLIGSNQSPIPWHTLLTGMIFIQIFYWGTNMVITQRALGAKSIKEAQKGIYAAAILKVLIPFIVVMPGIISFKLYGPIGDVSYGRLVGDLLPNYLSGAFAAVMLGAILSTFNSTLNSSAALYYCDIHEVFINHRANIKKVSTIFSVIIALIALCLVPVFQSAESIIAMLQQMSGLYSMPVLSAFLMALCWRNIDARAVIIGLIAGTLLYAVFTFVWSPLHYIHLMFITMCFCMLTSIVCSRVIYNSNVELILTKSSNKPAIDAIPK